MLAQRFRRTHDGCMTRNRYTQVLWRKANCWAKLIAIVTVHRYRESAKPPPRGLEAAVQVMAISADGFRSAGQMNISAISYGRGAAKAPRTFQTLLSSSWSYIGLTLKNHAAKLRGLLRKQLTTERWY